MNAGLEILVKTFTFLLSCGLGSLILLFSACSDQPSPKNRQAGTPPSAVVRLENGAFINRDGWFVPDTAKKNTWKATSDLKNTNTEQGKPVQVSITTFNPNSQVFYDEPFFAKGVTQLYGELELKRFEEYRANDKVYSFLITAKNRKLEVSDHNEMMVYRIVDTDGDGTFETLFDEHRDVPVPMWASIEPRH